MRLAFLQDGTLMMDIMTYDDLPRRLGNIIASLRRRTGPAAT